MQIRFHGKPSHAAEPENSICPVLPLAKLLMGLDKLANNDQDSTLFQVNCRSSIGLDVLNGCVCLYKECVGWCG